MENASDSEEIDDSMSEEERIQQVIDEIGIERELTLQEMMERDYTHGYRLDHSSSSDDHDPWPPLEQRLANLRR